MRKLILLGGLLAAMLINVQCSRKKQGNQNSDLYFDVKAVINKNPKEVETILGKPDSTYYRQLMSLRFLAQYYSLYDLEIQYMPPAELANDLVFNNVPLPLSVAALRNFGLKPVASGDFMENRYFKWYNHEGIGTINFYKNNVQTSDTSGTERFRAYFKVSQ